MHSTIERADTAAEQRGRPSNPDALARAELARIERHYETFPEDKLMLAAVAIDRVMERRRLLALGASVSCIIATLYRAT